MMQSWARGPRPAKEQARGLPRVLRAWGGSRGPGQEHAGPLTHMAWADPCG